MIRRRVSNEVPFHRVKVVRTMSAALGLALTIVLSGLTGIVASVVGLIIHIWFLKVIGLSGPTSPDRHP
jgi:type IV secretory pathway TrbD component